MAHSAAEPPVPQFSIDSEGRVAFQGHDVDLESASLIPPHYTIDLSVSPEHRYDEICQDFSSRVQSLPSLFDDIIQELGLGNPRHIHRMARLLLRRVYSAEQTQELRGISKNTGIDMYLLVAFNVLLDVLMGCTSGGVRVQGSQPNPPTWSDGQKTSEAGEERMLHFRTLDWGMDPLRKIIVQLDFVEKSPGPVIASTITYAGYVGVITGVRTGLSLSLNFRPCHDKSTRMANFRFYFHHLTVLFGFRPSISSLLRGYLIPAAPNPSVKAALKNPQHEATKTDIPWLRKNFPRIKTTAAYVTFCDGKETVIFEKDRAKAVLISSDEFAVATNHDVQDEGGTRDASSSKGGLPAAHSGGIKEEAEVIAGMEFSNEESIGRKGAICEAFKQTQCQRRKQTLSIASKRSKTEQSSSELAQAVIQQDDVVGWLNTYPITNEETHFATLMDAKGGEILWVRRYLEPVTTKANGGEKG